MGSSKSIDQLPKGYTLAAHLADYSKCSQGDMIRAILENQNRSPGSIRTMDIHYMGRPTRVYCIEDVVRAGIISHNNGYEQPDDPVQASGSEAPVGSGSAGTESIDYSRRPKNRTETGKSNGSNKRGLRRSGRPSKKLKEYEKDPDEDWIEDEISLGDNLGVEASETGGLEDTIHDKGGDEAESLGSESAGLYGSGRAGQSRSVMDIYFSQTRHTVLTREEEIEYARQIESRLSDAARLLFGEASDFFMTYFQAIDAMSRGALQESDLAEIAEFLPRRDYKETLGYLNKLLKDRQYSEFDDEDDLNQEYDSNGADIRAADSDPLEILMKSRHRHSRLQWIYEDMKWMLEMAYSRDSPREQNRAASQMGFRSIKEMEKYVTTIGNQLYKAQRAQKELISHNIRLAGSIAKRYPDKYIARMDHIQHANIGLLEAAERFDYHRGYRFSTYATWWIRQSIMRSIANTENTIRLPVHVWEGINKIKGLEKEYIRKEGRLPTDKELAEKLEVGIKTIKTYQKARRGEISTSKPIGNDKDGDFTIEDIVASDDNPEMLIAAMQDNSNLSGYLRELTPREEMVLRLRFGIGDGEDHTLEDIAGMMFGYKKNGQPKITRERVRQIEAKALRKLKRIIERKKASAEKRLKEYGEEKQRQREYPSYQKPPKYAGDGFEPYDLDAFELEKKEYARPQIKIMDRDSFVTTRHLAMIFRFDNINRLSSYLSLRYMEGKISRKDNKKPARYRFTKNLVEMLQDKKQKDKDKKYAPETSGKDPRLFFGQPLSAASLAALYGQDLIPLAKKLWKERDDAGLNWERKGDQPYYTLDERLHDLIRGQAEYDEARHDDREEPEEPQYSEPMPQEELSSLFGKKLSTRQIATVLNRNYDALSTKMRKIRDEQGVEYERIGNTNYYAVDKRLLELIEPSGSGKQAERRPEKREYSKPTAKRTELSSLFGKTLSTKQIAGILGRSHPAFNLRLVNIRDEQGVEYEKIWNTNYYLFDQTLLKLIETRKSGKQAERRPEKREYSKPTAKRTELSSLFGKTLSTRQIATVLNRNYNTLNIKMRKIRDEQGVEYERVGKSNYYLFDQTLLELIETSRKRKPKKQEKPGTPHEPREYSKPEIIRMKMSSFYGKGLTIQQMASIFMLHGSSLNTALYKVRDKHGIEYNPKEKPIHYVFDESLASMIRKKTASKGHDFNLFGEYTPPKVREFKGIEFTANQLAEIFGIKNLPSVLNSSKRAKDITFTKKGRNKHYLVDDALLRLVNEEGATGARIDYERPAIRRVDRRWIVNQWLTVNQLAQLYGWNPRSLATMIPQIRKELDLEYKGSKPARYRLSKDLISRLEPRLERLHARMIEEREKREESKKRKKSSKKSAGKKASKKKPVR